jgi:hypothetical protein
MQRERYMSRSVKDAIRRALAADEKPEPPARGGMTALRRRVAQRVLARLQTSPAATEQPRKDPMEDQTETSRPSRINGHGAPPNDTPAKLS